MLPGFLKSAAFALPGGLAEKAHKKLEDFDPKAIARGQKVESEHTSRKDITRQIAMDHLTEDPKYYEKLEKMEKEGFSTNEYSGPMNPLIRSQASDLPPMRWPRLEKVLQKNSGEKSAEALGPVLLKLAANTRPRGVQKNDGQTTMPTSVAITDSPELPNSLKLAMLQMSTPELGDFVALLKQASPSGDLRTAQHVGAPRAAPPVAKGPSIVQIAKPKGPGTGSGIPGAFKTNIGSLKPIGLR